YNAHKPLPAKGDQPAWERDDAGTNGGPRPAGYLDYLTWQSRTLCLHPAQEAEHTFVASVSYGQGRKLGAPELFDPMMAYRKDEKAGWRALRLSIHKELWRDSASLLQLPGHASEKRPDCFDWLQKQVSRGVLRRQQRYDLSVFGLCTNQAKVFFWRHERMPL